VSSNGHDAVIALGLRMTLSGHLNADAPSWPLGQAIHHPRGVQSS
jgi:hypothetical protein